MLKNKIFTFLFAHLWKYFYFRNGTKNKEIELVF